MFSIVTESQLALDSNYDRVRCLKHVGTEGFSVHNEAVLVRNPWLHKQLASARAQVRRGTFRYKRQLQQLLWVLMMANLKNGRPPALEPRTRALLLETFRRDVQELQVLLGRDLSSWLARR
jgi:hypothetical protein